ncbi:hypothetical protein EVAR_23507_1 [Eumeta japonica]|uniref:Uncharacterized protein n=1 Tax=Eumeta variegata TaxID=151549 RepID=A0A4C1W4D4_EUMVA|nr:hypothetical protein EVAR_23507_1 [Eumeta japonica]
MTNRICYQGEISKDPRMQLKIVISEILPRNVLPLDVRYYFELRTDNSAPRSVQEVSTARWRPFHTARHTVPLEKLSSSAGIGYDVAQPLRLPIIDSVSNIVSEPGTFQFKDNARAVARIIHRNIEGQMNMRTTRVQVVTVAHKHSIVRSSYQRVAGLLTRYRTSDGTQSAGLAVTNGHRTEPQCTAREAPASRPWPAGAPRCGRRARRGARCHRRSSLFNMFHLLKLHNLCVNNDDCDESSWAMRASKPD